MNKILRNIVLSTSAAVALFFVGCGSNTKTTSMSEQYQFKGVLNTDFANTGYAVYDSGNGSDVSWDIAIDSDENIYAAGNSNNDTIVLKYKSDGTLDTSFGTDGVVSYDSGGEDNLYGIALDSKNNIYVTGRIGNDMAIWKYTSLGTLDTSFGSSGVVTYDGGDNDRGYRIALDSNNNIYVTGQRNNGSNDDVPIWKYTSSGTPDTSFGSNGIVIYDGGAADYGYRIAFDSNNNIYVTGYSYNGSNNDIIILKYTSSGTPDTSFGSSGIVTYDRGAEDLGYGIALDSNNNIYVTGQTQGSNNDMIVLKYTSSGTPDTSFGTNGVVTHDNAAGATTAGVDYGYSVIVDFVDDIYITGTSNNGKNFDMVIWKYKSDGSLDTSFNSTGYVVHDNATGGLGTDQGKGITFNSSKNNIYVSGYSNNGKNNDIVVWNYQ